MPVFVTVLKHPLYIMRIITALLCILSLSLMSANCRKTDNNSPGKGGSATLIVNPQHHEVDSNIKRCKVYIKYGAVDAPANGVYDDSATCVVANNKALASFTSLKNGNYYLYGVGFDTSVPGCITGGIGYTISQQSSQTMFLPVSECNCTICN